ncbi:MAG: hypothetical protein A4E19_04855 [Nitrospira sp. SG-bin1]|nr:MAG: hypothetical protein A4E19_04855 [Nitrospira sp. SG-bin1]
MKASWKTGLGFGLTSGVITTVGLIVGLHSGTHSRTAVLGGILTIAIADALSDALGIHIAEEANRRGPSAHVWESTAVTFAAKFTVAVSFAIPVLLLSLETAVIASLIWGISLLCLLSWIMARAQQLPTWTVVGEHLIIACAVIVITFYLGRFVSKTFG